MFKVVSFNVNYLPRCFNNNPIKRFFLSNAYKCEEAWKNRLKNPVFQKTPPSGLYHDLDICFQKKIHVNVLDVDLLLSGAVDHSFKNELEDVLLRLRQTPESRILPERATHAAIRWYMDHTSKEDLLNALSDRLNYGLFPDYFLNNILMDKYLKENDPVAAVKIAVLQMLQEDFDHPIMKVLALHCCYNYLESPDIWENYKEPEPDPDEVKKVRVRFLRNPYFDDHFDITDTNHLVGKTLWLFGRTVDGAVGTSSELVGLVLYEKYDRCAEFLENVIKEERKIHSDAVEKAKDYILTRPKQVKSEDKPEDSQEGDKQEEKKEPLDQCKVKVLELLKKIEGENLEKGSLLTATSEMVKDEVKQNESSDIKHQCEVYKQWEEDRENAIKIEIEKVQQENIKSEIKKMKEELEQEEERLFFFDREEEITTVAEMKEEQKESVVFYKGKGKHRDHSAEEYVPPDISKKNV